MCKWYNSQIIDFLKYIPKNYKIIIIENSADINLKNEINKLYQNVDIYLNSNLGYGAAAKANTFINFSRIKFDFIIDDNKFKQNKFCPGSKIPIRSINVLNKIKQNIVIVPLAWNFYSEIKSKVIKLRKNKKDKFLLCFPKLKLDKV